MFFLPFPPWLVSNLSSGLPQPSGLPNTVQLITLYCPDAVRSPDGESSGHFSFSPASKSCLTLRGALFLEHIKEPGTVHGTLWALMEERSSLAEWRGRGSEITQRLWLAFQLF